MINQTADMHDDVLYVTMKKCERYFDIPADAEVMHYYVLRGLDRPDADAIVLLGAPHPNEDALRSEAELLTIDNPTITAGGRELSTRQPDGPHDDVGDPVYRRINYIDDDGDGREVASKTYTGITGDLFDDKHGAEIEQAAHRIRPVLAGDDEQKYIYALTNVATTLPIDRLTSFDALADPIDAGLDIRESAVELLDSVTDVAQAADDDIEYAADGGVITVGATGSEWHEAAQDAGMDVSRMTVSRALDDLKDAALVREGGYAHRRGKILTLTELGARVASR